MNYTIILSIYLYSVNKKELNVLKVTKGQNLKKNSKNVAGHLQFFFLSRLLVRGSTHSAQSILVWTRVPLQPATGV